MPPIKRKTTVSKKSGHLLFFMMSDNNTIPQRSELQVATSPLGNGGRISVFEQSFPMEWVKRRA
jgi:hypothetical protein